MLFKRQKFAWLGTKVRLSTKHTRKDFLLIAIELAGTRSDELLSRYVEGAGDVDDQDIMFLVGNLTINKDDSREASVADLELDEAKQKINDWIELEQRGGRPRWFEIRMVVENAMKNSYGISNIGPAAVLTARKDGFDENRVMRY